MANLNKVQHKPVKITLNDGVEREINFTLNAMAFLEERYGSVDEAFALLDKHSIKALRCILWAGLHKTSPDLTEEQVGDLIDTVYLQDLMESMGMALKYDVTGTEKTPDVEPVPGTEIDTAGQTKQVSKPVEGLAPNA
jgi:hypothetical protein